MRLILALALAASLTAFPALAQHEHHAPAAPDPHAAQGPMPGMDQPAEDAHAGHAMNSPLGPYAMSRDGSGTSWQPQASPMAGVHAMAGDWMVMGHALINGVYVNQGGPRGGDKGFVAGMVGVMAQRQAGPGTLGLRAMLSPDPFMGKSGYPLLLAAGESADGAETLIDRQHPHDLFMELSASYSVPVGESGSVFLYGGLPGEPAFGPPAFMHRASSLDSPEAPITHHWLDSTHIVFGVVTAGVTWDRWKLDASAFNGREPDEDRFDIETGELDSRAARVSFNPSENWALQASWASIKSPEALEPDHDERRVSASAMYGRAIGDDGFLALTAAWARKDKVPGEVLDAALLEASLAPNDRWTVFGRAEQVDQDELGVHHGPAYVVRKASVGAIRDVRIAPHVKVGIGALVSVFDIEAPLSATYDDPTGAMGFVRLKIG
jgi:hypothetical protein